MVGKLRFQRLRVILIRKDGKRRVNYLHSAGDKSVWRNRHNHGGFCCQYEGLEKRDGFDLADCRERVAGNLHRGHIGNGAIHGDSYE